MRNAPAFDTLAILDGIREWVEIESPTTDAAAVKRMVDKVAEGFAGMQGLTSLAASEIVVIA